MKCPDANGERLGLTLGLAWFGVRYLAPVVQIQIAIALGLALGLARFGLAYATSLSNGRANLRQSGFQVASAGCANPQQCAGVLPPACWILRPECSFFHFLAKMISRQGYA